MFGRRCQRNLPSVVFHSLQQFADLGLLALQKISAFTVSLTYNLEPVYGILLAFVVFREDKYFNKGFYLGLGIILGSFVLQMGRLGRRKQGSIVKN